MVIQIQELNTNVYVINVVKEYIYNTYMHYIYTHVYLYVNEYIR